MCACTAAHVRSLTCICVGLRAEEGLQREACDGVMLSYDNLLGPEGSS